MPPRTLTKAQFNQARPGGDYKKYLKYVRNFRAEKARTMQADPAAAIMQYLNRGMLSGKQQIALANQQVNAQIKASKQDILDASRKAYEQADAQARAAQGFAQALGGYSQGDAAAIGAIYGDAANDMRAFASGLAGSGQAAQQAKLDVAGGQINAMAPGAVVATPSPGAIAATTNYLGGELPARTLAMKGQAGAERELALNTYGDPSSRPGAWQMRLADFAADMRRQGVQASGDAARQIANLAKTRPDLYAKALQDIKSSGRSDAASLIQAMYLRASMDKDAWNKVYQEAGLTGTYNGKPTVAATTAAASAAAAAQRIAVQRMNAQTSRMRADIAQQNADTSALAAAGKVDEAESKFRKDAKAYTDRLFGKLDRRGKPQYRPAKKATLVHQIYNLYGLPLVGTGGLTEGKVKKWATQVVNTYPQRWWNPNYWKKKTPKAGTGGTTGGTTPGSVLQGG